MPLFWKIDDFLFDKCFQPFTDWFHNLTGKNNFWLCRVLLRANLVVSALMAGCVFVLAVFVPWWPFKILFGVMGLVMVHVAFMNVGRLKARRNLESKLLAREGTMNPLRAIGFALTLRMVTLFFMIATALLYGSHLQDPLLLLIAVSNVLQFLDTYFMACTPNPRKRKPVKVKKAAEAPLGALPQGA